jgi:hypothetical protein
MHHTLEGLRPVRIALVQIPAGSPEDRHFTVTTDQLLLDRAFGYLQAEDYIEWAVEQLRSGADGASLRILAGREDLPRARDRVDAQGPYAKGCCPRGADTLRQGSAGS